MSRIALALIAIIVLAFSTGSTRAQLEHTASNEGSQAGIAFAGALPGAEQPLLAGASTGDTQPGRAEQAPALALLIYLGLIVVGSIIAIGLLWQRRLR